jgi:hypothetical protein
VSSSIVSAFDFVVYCKSRAEKSLKEDTRPACCVNFATLFTRLIEVYCTRLEAEAMFMVDGNTQANTIHGIHIS